MFEDFTYERLLEDVLDNAPKGIDTRQGSIFYDTVAGILIKVAKLYTDLELVFELSQIDTATGEYLDIKASEYGVDRHPALPAQYNVNFIGTTPMAGERFFTNGLYFRLKEDENGGRYLESEIVGTTGNDVPPGEPAIPVSNIAGLTSATFGALKEYGTNAEDDESLRTRVKEKIAGPAENGNKQHYKTWCESIEGVGRARINSLWNGPNTVKAVLINPLGLPSSEQVVTAVQEYIDPATKGYTTTVGGKTYVVGDGLGEGVANLGAHFTAVAAGTTEINVSFRAELATGISVDTAKEQAEEALAAYLKDLVLAATDAADVIVRMSAIGAILSGLPAILDYVDLKINGGTQNIAPGEDNVPGLREVSLNVI